MIMIVAITLKFIHSTYGIREKTPNLMRSTSTPNLRILYNETSSNNNMNIISYNEYKNNIYNRYKRNTYLRSKEKYSFDNK
jgi:hypothetical protein